MEGRAGRIRNAGTPNVSPRTEWKTDDIWIRREVTLPDLKKARWRCGSIMTTMRKSYLNGVLAGKFAGYSTNYEVSEIASAAATALKPGKNVIAIHCHQVYGGQYIDAGLLAVQQASGK